MPTPEPIRKYQALDPYNHVVDNQPIEDLELNLGIINTQVDLNTLAISDSIGTQGTLANRLNQSINDDGSLKTEAIDAAAHSIAEHTDDGGFVRMTDSERSKLDLIASGATDLKIMVEAISTTPLFDTGTVTIKESDSISWRVTGTEVYADVAFPLASRHQHYYNIEPYPVVPLSPDYQNYYTTSVQTAYKEGSLRINVNGMRINPTNSNDPILFPRASGDEATWVELSYDEDTATDGIVTSGKFTLSDAIDSSDRIYIDFDISLS